MEIIFKHVEMENFKNQSKLSTSFGDITNIFGRNGAGKSTVADAVAWVFTGRDQIGVKLDPNPVDNPELESKVTLTILVDGEETILARAQKKTAKYYINEIPKKATEFNQFTKELFDENLFLSMFNPIYFFTQNWKDQRAQVLEYVDEPLNSEVFAELPDIQSKLLQEHMKKHSLDELESKHKERFKDRDTQYTRVAERLLTLQEQLEKDSGSESIDPEAIQKEIDSLVNERDGLDENRHKAFKAMQNRTALQSEIEHLSERIFKQRELALSIREEKLEDSCRTCGQELDITAFKTVKEHHAKRFKDAIEKGKGMTAELQELKEKLAALPEVEASGTQQQSKELDDRVYQLMTKRDTAGRNAQLESDIKEATENKERVLQERNESQSIREAIKDFEAKQALVMVKKVDSLFTTISVQLFEELKNGNRKDAFEINMDGKPYSKLSTAEKIRCGLEMVEVLSQQSGVIVPTFVDNAESILKYIAPTGQLITASVRDHDLKINVRGKIKEVAS
ncbi:hypothetical protein [Bacillus sp. FSL K6-3431]|uniref:hypothetical protein n=1 Tax=Bacillus sp. FSL K6-3431 TaxID=2921500 RepID=UPI0030F7AF36